jgi:hypothetical protein
MCSCRLQHNQPRSCTPLNVRTWGWSRFWPSTTLMKPLPNSLWTYFKTRGTLHREKIFQMHTPKGRKETGIVLQNFPPKGTCENRNDGVLVKSHSTPCTCITPTPRGVVIWRCDCEASNPVHGTANPRLWGWHFSPVTDNPHTRQPPVTVLAFVP